MSPKSSLLPIGLMMTAAFIMNAHDGKFPKLSGPYLGQKPPGTIPELFAPGIVSAGEGAGCYGFMNNGTIFVFERCPAGADWKSQPLQVMEEKNGAWTEPAPDTLGGLYPYNFTVGPDGRTLYFSSLRLPDGSGPHRFANIWKVERTSGGWSQPAMFAPPVNSDGPDAYPTATNEGTLYFMSVRPGGLGKDDIYRAPRKNGQYPDVENVGAPVNSEYSEVDIFVAPDESLLVFCSDRPGGVGKFDLYVSFLGPDNRWSKPANLGPAINTPGQEFRPGISADGKYFFFTRYVEGGSQNGLFWVAAKVIDALRPRQ